LDVFPSAYSKSNCALFCSIADPTYNKEVALVQDKQASVKMIRSGETAFEKGKWYINDEMVRRGILALFPISL
jgi:hypothetical protein